MFDNFQILEWDSEFFGFKVGRIDHNFLERGRDNGSIQRLLDEDVKLCYCFSDSPLDVSLFSKEFDVLLVDEKIPLVKRLDRQAVTHPKVSLYTKRAPEENLIKLAIRAGEQSRFMADPRIPKYKVEELFKIWIEKSVKKELATDVLVYRENTEIIGFLIIQIKADKPYASLMAVQAEYEGKGIAFALMRTGEEILTSRGYSHVWSATQMSNRKALLIYNRHGLEQQDPVYVYHIWKKRR